MKTYLSRTRRFNRLAHLAFGMALPAILVAGPAAAGGFEFKDTPGEYIDVVFDGKICGRYMYAFDQSNEDRLHETYKPYLHVFDEAGKAPITKGPGGKYTHHRGIFVGWNKLGFEGAQHDLWHMKGVYQVHQKFLEKEAGADRATLTSLIHWNGPGGEPILAEERTMAFRTLPAPGMVIVDLSTRLEAVRGAVQLNGDPEHSGTQYRPANEVVVEETTYVFPKEGADPKQDKDYPWVGETYTLEGKRYSVIHMNHPGNPKGTVYSAYRDYGRFGAFFTKDIAAGETLELEYRFLVSAGEMPSAAAIQQSWDQFAGAKTPSAIPKLTVLGGIQKGSKVKANK